MKNSAAAAASPLSGEVMFYKNPEPLNSQVHAKLGINPSPTPFAFAKNAHAIPLIVAEFGPTSMHFPIIFAGGDYQPLAIMSVRTNENLFLGESGTFPDYTYVPAFIRRYPFVFAQDPKQDQLIVCIDRGAEFITENAEVPFFVNGEASPFTKQCLDFCTSFEQERRKTEDFVKTLRELELFELKEVNFTPRNPDGTNGQTVKVSEYFSPSEEKVKALPDAAKLDLMNSGALQQIHLHWNSLANWERLINETLKLAPAPTKPAPAANG